MNAWAQLAGTCALCAAPIVWAQPARGRGRPFPLDAAGDGSPLHVAGGTIQTAHTVTVADRITQLVVTVTSTPDPQLGTYRPHSETCPNTGKRRRR